MARHHKPRSHPTKRQRQSDALSEAEREHLIRSGIFDNLFAPPPLPKPVKLKPGRPKRNPK